MGLYSEKYPTTVDKYVGIEIECFANEDEDVVVDILNKYKLDDYVEIADDSSIDSEDIDETVSNYDTTFYRKGYEFKILSKQSELKDVLARMGKALVDMRADVNESCGLHVHLDMRNRKVMDSVTKLLNVQPLMLKAVPSSRRNNSFCMPVTKQSIDDGYKIGKYHVINTECLEDLNTIEVRVHEGTTNTDEIYKWCKFLIQTIDGSFATKLTRTTTKLPIRLKKYLNERIRAC